MAMLAGLNFSFEQGRIELNLAPQKAMAAWPEPNNVPDDASDIAKDRFGYTWTDHLCPSGDVDYYRFDVKQGETYTIDLWHLPADLDFRVYGQALQKIGESRAGGTKPESFSFTPPEHTTEVWVEIFGFQGASGCDAAQYYLFKVESTETDPCVADQFEPNNSKEAASFVGSETAHYVRIGTICESDVDWYKLSVEAGWTASNAEMSVPADYDLSLLDTDGTSVLKQSRRSGTRK